MLVKISKDSYVNPDNIASISFLDFLGSFTIIVNGKEREVSEEEFNEAKRIIEDIWKVNYTK